MAPPENHGDFLFPSSVLSSAFAAFGKNSHPSWMSAVPGKGVRQQCFSDKKKKAFAVRILGKGSAFWIPAQEGALCDLEQHPQLSVSSSIKWANRNTIRVITSSCGQVALVTHSVLTATPQPLLGRFQKPANVNPGIPV